MSKRVKSVEFNWHQVGSLQNSEGCDESYNKVVVGESYVTLIEENEPTNGMQQWNYVVHYNDGTTIRIFNPNFVHYFKD